METKPLSTQSETAPDTQPGSPLYAQIDAAIQAHPQDRTFKLMTADGQELWVKTPSTPRLRWLYTVTNSLMSCLGMPYFQAPPHAGGPGGVQSLQIEKTMLCNLRQAGIRVPQVIASTDKWLVLQSVGDKNLDEQLQALPWPERQNLWQQAVKAIAFVHAQNRYLSQCFARNMLLSESIEPDGTVQYQISFLDFEENPAAVMTPAQAQVRDWALFLHSTASLVMPDMASCQNYLFETLKKENCTVQTEAQKLFKQLARLRILKKLQWLGRDGIRLYQLGVFAAGIQQQFADQVKPF